MRIFAIISLFLIALCSAPHAQDVGRPPATPNPTYISRVNTIYNAGDSMGAGDGGSGGNARWFVQSYIALGRATYTTQALGGTTSAQMRTTFQANTTNTNWLTYIWSCHNGSPTPSQCVNDIYSMLQHMNVTPGQRCVNINPPLISATSAVGSAGYNNTLAIRSALLSTFPNYYNSLLLPALAAGGNGSAQDNQDIANGYTPSSLRSGYPGVVDPLHLGDPGQNIVFPTVDTNVLGQGC